MADRAAIELIGGPESRPVVLVDPDPRWPERFGREADRIRAALGADALRIDHIGSTAVPGLAAKPIVDVQLSVADIGNEAGYLPQLTRAGYRLRVREPDHRMLRTPELDVHLHVCARGGPWERRHLLFRDWLRRSPADRRRYAVCKRQLARRAWPTMQAYADAKGPTIDAILERATRWAEGARWPGAAWTDPGPGPTGAGPALRRR